jgi:glyoxylase-like metal-dependent hydrolase (beta-lactamase superfamily II)
MADVAPEGVVRVRAGNPSPLTLDGTNTYLVERWVVDPGPLMDAHLEAILAAAGPDGIEGIVLTHDHPDHSEAAPELARRAGGAPVELPGEGDRVGPFEVVATPGHSPDHVALLFGRVCFTGDTVLGLGSVFISPGEGSLAAYLDSLRRLRELDLEAICPGHGPIVNDPRAKLDDYIEHRLERERWILEALDRGARTRDEILDQAWSDVDLDAVPFLRLAAGATLVAHLEKLAEEGRLPADLDRSSWQE